MTPYFQRPLELGADDRRALADEVPERPLRRRRRRADLQGQGAARSPRVPAERGRRGAVADGQLPRAARHQDAARPHGAPRENARTIAAWLEKHPQVEQGDLPGPRDRIRSTRSRSGRCAGFGGMISFVLRGGSALERARVLSACKIFTLAESLGGVESLIEHPAIMTHASVPPATGASSASSTASSGCRSASSVLRRLDSGSIQQALDRADS